MKKLIALVLCLIMVFGVSAVAMAAESPVAPTKVAVELRKGKGVKVVTGMDSFFDATGQNVIVEADDSFGKFDKWILYKKDGSAAVANTDFVLVNCKDTDKKLEFQAKTDIIVCANYDGKITNPLEASNPNTPVSPTTGDVNFVVLAFVLALGAAAAFSAKKVLSK